MAALLSKEAGPSQPIKSEVTRPCRSKYQAVTANDRPSVPGPLSPKTEPDLTIRFVESRRREGDRPGADD